VCWSIVVEEPKVGYPFFGAFRCDRFAKAKNDINVHFAIPSLSIPANYPSEFREPFEATKQIMCFYFCMTRELYIV
jgi:hypothetical protein